MNNQEHRAKKKKNLEFCFQCQSFMSRHKLWWNLEKRDWISILRRQIEEHKVALLSTEDEMAM